ncbi:hypothetical protein TCDM_00715 [Trypanosoma cruzi Dm28c]|uniref:Uncharacterized protein n=1 Tax=Trypanosoma cruzi Dm28c TaxID=1416333 RepID=V5BBE6_TRYCR|nr:hypothetical protein TCDM_00715 [Trypanosoma cruzi Dm28c]
MFRSTTINTSLRLPPNILLPNHPFPAPPVVCAYVCLSVCLSVCVPAFLSPSRMHADEKRGGSIHLPSPTAGGGASPCCDSAICCDLDTLFLALPLRGAPFPPFSPIFFPRHNRGAERPRRRVPAKVDEYKKSGIRPPPPPPPLPSPLRSHPTSPSAAESFFFPILFSSPPLRTPSSGKQTNKKKKKKTVFPHPFIFFSSLTHQPPIYLFIFSSFGQSLRRLTKGLHYLCVCVVLFLFFLVLFSVLLIFLILTFFSPFHVPYPLGFHQICLFLLFFSGIIYCIIYSSPP